MAQAVAEAEQQVKNAAEVAFEAKMKEKEREIQHLKGWLEKGEAAWKDQQDANARMRSRLDEYSQRIIDGQKELDSYKHQVETLTRRCETLQREQGDIGSVYKEVAQLQDLLDKEKSDFADAQQLNFS